MQRRSLRAWKVAGCMLVRDLKFYNPNPNPCALERQWKILFSSPCVVAHEDPGRKSAEDSGGLSINKHEKSQLWEIGENRFIPKQNCPEGGMMSSSNIYKVLFFLRAAYSQLYLLQSPSSPSSNKSRSQIHGGLTSL